LVGGPEGQDGSNAGEIEAVVEELTDLSEADEVIVAVAAGATLAAGWIDQASGLVEPEILGSAAHQLGRYGDPIQTPVRTRTAVRPCRLPLENSSKPLAPDMVDRI